MAGSTSVFGRPTRLAMGCPTKLEPGRPYDRSIDMAASLIADCPRAYKGVLLIMSKATNTPRPFPLYLLLTSSWLQCSIILASMPLPPRRIPELPPFVLCLHHGTLHQRCTSWSAELYSPRGGSSSPTACG